MEKRCIFCGNIVQDKTKEHVIPKWLIEMTGNPKRKFTLGPFFLLNHKYMQFSADSFQFPACDKCNSNYSQLEGKAKAIINAITEGNVDVSNISILLDWFDKVRIGLWLGYRYLDKDFWKVHPNFYISQRIGYSDRLLLIYHLNSQENILNFGGINSPVFSFMPSAFVLRIKNTIFYNIGIQGIISRRIGFPYFHNGLIRKDGKQISEIQDGIKKIKLPIVRDKFISTKNQYYQAIIPEYNVYIKDFDQGTIKYIEEHESSIGSGKSKIYDGYSNCWLENSDYIKINSEALPGNSNVEYRKLILDCCKRQLNEYEQEKFDKDSFGLNGYNEQIMLKETICKFQRAALKYRTNLKDIKIV